MSQGNKQVMQQFFDAVNAHDPDRLLDYLADDMVEHEVFPGLEPNREGVRDFFRMFIAAFPDLRFDVEQMIAEGDTVAALVRMTGTHEGDFAGVPPSGRRIDLHTVDIVRFNADGQAAEHWGVTDSGLMMQQVGATAEATTT